MPDLSYSSQPGAAPARGRNLSLIAFLVVIAAGIAYVGTHLASDLSPVRETSAMPWLLLGIALLIALGFEFVNGFHDTANAVATVIYTHSLTPNLAVVWSGAWNFLGVLTSTGAVAFGILQLLPVELILQVGNSAGFAMVFALLIAAIIWNLGTWYFGLPSSSSHTLIGSIIGVGLMNQMLHGASGTSGVDWSQALGVGKSLLFSPVVGFIAAGLLLLVLKALVRIPALYAEPKGKEPPPFWIRALLILTCTGVSFAHGSNDGQKGMGLIMLILIGTVPTAYALNRAVTPAETQTFVAVAQQAAQTLGGYTNGVAAPANPRAEVERFVSSRQLTPQTVPALQALTTQVGNAVAGYGSIADVPQASVDNVRNDMYVTSEAIRLMQKSNQPAFSPDAEKAISNFRTQIDHATKFIPTWVKVAVAIALGLGTMVGWKRIVVTVGEKIGKQHLSYGQGGCAELVAMATIGAADVYGLPVSTTHVLSSGVAGTMAANGSGLQWSTVRSLVLAWVLTLPASILLAAGLYWLFRHLF
ncbi:inorganic phosphate transporter [Paraburkholderia caballeronis]|uniref:Phosphate transporter n=1 Tax=Paraburkholderia caballeronis TaxID=416943 RepID=A0A1H7QCV4_9BURK|nr:inorganic phosphate transporter [Paraburkholderia caballeronis]PXW16402.1 PiT family inorganic phosphate transporter [Paraburkholderia caballeronis]PXW94079.1 PiT family inorganic phosphate transporter [Paraburkholderia caballeronis]RAJ89143.1 PiT family inorganic phosphate transporter [Paraburkholderia caballeronis]TDV14931.1 PiT family inorganic phosphate transporter [Paraburkholderia caballeronis]TDV16945.1 PiT family inorganic phosphate transporter [Paraburkholderia caballeronis]